MELQTVRFSRKDPQAFFKTLNARINDYFKENNIKKTGNWKLYLKTIVMFSLFLTPYFLILTIDMNQWLPITTHNSNWYWYGWRWNECHA